MANRSSQHDRVEETSGIFGRYKFIKLKSGRKLSFWDAHTDAERAETALHTAVSRMFKLQGEYDRDWIVRRIEKLEEWVAALRAYLSRLEEEDAIRERIASLRNTTGREPEEAKRFLAKADELEAKLLDPKETRR